MLNEISSNKHLFSIAYDFDNNKEIDAELYVVSIDNGKSFEMIYKKYISNDVVSFYNYKGSKVLTLTNNNRKLIISDENPQELLSEVVSNGYWGCVYKRYHQLKTACESNPECDTLCDMLPNCHGSMMAAAMIKCL